MAIITQFATVALFQPYIPHEIPVVTRPTLSHPLDGEHGKKALAVRQWETLNPDKLKYEMIFTAMEMVPWDDTSGVREGLR